MKLWLKASPDITAETLGVNPIQGMIPALVNNPNSELNEFYSTILLSEWSVTEVTPAPEGVPETGYLVLYGDDPARVQYEFHTQELDAAVSCRVKSNGFGYVEVSVNRNAMFPV